MSWVHVVGTNLDIVGTCRGYMSWVHNMSWVRVVGTCNYIVDTYRGYTSWVSSNDYILGPQVSSGRVLCTIP